MHWMQRLSLLTMLLFACSTLDKLQPRVVSFEEQVTTLREHLASLLEGEEDWSRAAQTLAGIDLDSGTWLYSPPADWQPWLLSFSLQ